MFSCDHHNPWTWTHELLVTFILPSLSLNVWVCLFLGRSFTACILLLYCLFLFCRMHSNCTHYIAHVLLLHKCSSLSIYLRLAWKRLIVLELGTVFFILSFVSLFQLHRLIFTCSTLPYKFKQHPHTHKHAYTHAHTVSLLAACLASVLTQNEHKSHTKRKSKC